MGPNTTREKTIHKPDREFVESTNVYALMQTYNIENYDELIEHATTDLGGRQVEHQLVL